MQSIDLPDTMHAAERVAQWLLHGPAQVPAGPQAGGVAGALDANLRPRYVYAEITGYYLQWLAWQASIHGANDALCRRARAGQQWLRGWLDSAEPLTRVYPDAPVDDWRNRTRFTFDLAMALRGVGSAAARGVLRADPHVVAALCRELGKTVGADGAFEACTHPAGGALPVRWSTRRGGFLTKAAAGVIRAAGQLPSMPEEIVGAARATFDAAMDRTMDAPHQDTHPLLYAFEGIVALPDHPRHQAALDDVIRQYDDLLTRSEDLGRVAETRSGDGPERVDVLAQTVRMGDLLDRVGEMVTRGRLSPLRRRLLAAVRADGSVPFAMDEPRSPANVWAAMFASQALEGLDAHAGDAALLIV